MSGVITVVITATSGSLGETLLGKRGEIVKTRFAGAIVVVLGAVLFCVPMASAAPGTKTFIFPLSGNSSTTLFNKHFECCHIAFDVDPFGSFDGNISADVDLAID